MHSPLCNPIELPTATGTRPIIQGRRPGVAVRMITLGVGLAITIMAAHMPADEAVAATPTAAGTAENRGSTSPDEAGYKKARGALDRLYAALDVISSKIDRSQFEIDAAADHVGSDPAAIFHFVRDQIRYEPYVGVLRGALGTLLCRAGNSLDRSLLLAAMLEKAGFRTQIASGQLNASQAQVLVSRVFDPARPVPNSLPPFVDMASEVARAEGVDQAKLLQIAADVEAHAAQNQKGLLDYVDGETAFLANLLGKAGVDAGVITANDQLLAEAGEHFWVQYQDSSGQWVDLDSAFIDAEPGKSVASPTDTFTADSVPEQLYHHLKVSLTLRVAQIVDGSDGPTNDIVLLERELRVAEQQGKAIILANSPVPMPNVLKPGIGFAQAFAPVKGYQSTLQVGDQVTPGLFFDLDGQVSDKPGGPVGDVVTNAGGIGASARGLAGGMNSVFGGGDDAPNPTRIVGEWAEYTLSSPRPHSDPPVMHTYHRDILAAAAVKSWTPEGGAEAVPTNLGKDALQRLLMWNVELSPVTGAVVSNYAGYLELQALALNREPMGLIAKMRSGLASDQAPPNFARLPVTDTLLSAGKMQISNSLMAAKFPALRSYFNTPGLIAYETAVVEAPTGPAFREGYDIVAYPPRAVASRVVSPAIAHQQAALLHITYGTLATRAERSLMLESRASKSNGGNITNTTNVFTVAQGLGVPIAVLRQDAGGLNGLANAAMPAQVKSELAEDLMAQQVLLVPSKSVTVDGRLQTAWWRFDALSGELIGVGPGERGQSNTEIAIFWIENANFVICMVNAVKDKQILSGCMCFVSRLLGAEGEEGDRLMNVMGILAEIVMKVGEAAAGD